MTLKKDFIILKDNCKIALAKHEFLFKFAAHSGSSFTSYRRDGRVVECTGLENQRTERYRGFESLSLRQKHLKTSVLRWFFLYPFANEARFSERDGYKKYRTPEADWFSCVFGTVPLQGSFERSEKKSQPLERLGSNLFLAITVFTDTFTTAFFDRT